MPRITRYIDNPPVRATCLHNSIRWQVSEMHGGLGAELLLKRRDVAPKEAKELKLSEHDCFPSIFFQGEPASEFLAELKDAQSKLSTPEVDRLFLDRYLVAQEFQ